MNDRIYKKLETRKNGTMSISMSSQLAFWEDYGDEEATVTGVVVDTVKSPQVAYEDLPALIHFLSQVYEKRVTRGERHLNVCPHCKREYEE